MALRNRISRLFRRVSPDDLLDPEKRERLANQYFADAFRLQEQHPQSPEDYEAPVHELRGQMKEVGLEERELYRLLWKAAPDREHWRRWLADEMLRLPNLEDHDLVLLEQIACREARYLRLWNRILEERYRAGDDLKTLQTKEVLVLALRDFFPPGAESRWYDVDTEREARTLFENSLDEVSDHLLESGRSDRNAESILRLATDFFPHSLKIRAGYSKLLKHAGATDSVSLGVILETLQQDPENFELMRYAGDVLSSRRGHEAEGIALLLQALDQRPDDAGLLALIAERVRTLNSEPEPEMVDVVRRHLARAPEDAETAAWLGEVYAGIGEYDTPAVETWECALSHAGEDGRKWRVLLGEAHARREDWDRTIEVLQDLLQEGDSEQDVVFPLARAYARAERIDRLAVTAYQCAIDSGIDDPAVHDQLCHFYYDSQYEDDNVLEEFRAADKVAGGQSRWAKLGLMQQRIKQGEAAAVLDEVSRMLASDYDDESLIGVAAEALAEDARRPQLRKVMALRPNTSLAIFEKAAEMQPESLLLLSTLARYRLSHGRKTEETAKLLSEICRRDPEELELRIARADILFELGQRENAGDLYREIMDRMRTSSSSASMIRISLDEVDRIEKQFLLCLKEMNDPSGEDVDYLMREATKPGASHEILMTAAEVAATREDNSPLRMAVLERALVLDPDNESLEIALAGLKARKGAPRPALQMALRRLRNRRYEGVPSLLRAARTTMQPHHVTPDVKRDFLHVAFRQATLPDDLLVEIARTLVTAHLYDPKLITLFERAVALAPGDEGICNAIQRWDELQDRILDTHEEDLDI